MIRRRFTQRPDHFTVDPTVGLARGLVFAGLGGGHGSVVMRDSSPGKKNDGTLINMDPADDWQWSGELGRWVTRHTENATHVLCPNISSQLGALYTVSLWAKQTAANLRGTFFSSAASGNNLNCFRFNSDTSVFVQGSPSVPYANWLVPSTSAGYSHYSFVTDGVDAITLWLNGGARETRSGVILPNWTTPTIGCVAAGTDGAYNYGGNNADVLIHSRALTPAEIQQLADPSNVMLSGLILPPRRRVWPSAVVPLSLPDYPDVSNESPFANAESIVTVAATGGSAPYSYSLTAQSTTVGMLKVTGTLSPDATGIYTENGTYNGEPAYERADGAYWIWFDNTLWVLSTTKGGLVTYPWYRSTTVLGDYTPVSATGTATVAAYEPFEINSSTGEITITDATGLAVGQVWTLTVRATDSLSDTDDRTVTVELVGAAAFNPAWAARCNNLIGAGI